MHATEVAGIDGLLGINIKDGAVLTGPVTDICNRTISFNNSPGAFKLTKDNPIFKKCRKTNVSYFLIAIDNTNFLTVVTFNSR